MVYFEKIKSKTKFINFQQLFLTQKNTGRLPKSINLDSRKLPQCFYYVKELKYSTSDGILLLPS